MQLIQSWVHFRRDVVWVDLCKDRASSACGHKEKDEEQQRESRCEIG